MTSLQETVLKSSNSLKVCSATESTSKEMHVLDRMNDNFAAKRVNPRTK